MDIWTAQYRYSGPDRLDITVKGNDPFGKIFAPTWNMVKGYNNGKGLIGKGEYTNQYYTLLKERYSAPGGKNFFDMLMSLKEVTFVCFCPPQAFCHRHLLVDFLQAIYRGVVTIDYKGERTI